MTLHEAIASAGMSPPPVIPVGRWVRFPGSGKKRDNRAGWCKRISETLAIFGDWSTGLTETWRDGSHRDDAESQRLLAEARDRERRYAQQNARRAAEVARQALVMISEAKEDSHPYLLSKGFRTVLGLVRERYLLIPVRSVDDYSVISIQTVAQDGTKKFLPGGRTKGGIYRMGTRNARTTVLCEGFATGLSLRAAMDLLSPSFAIIVCFSATNLVHVASRFPGAVVAADNDKSKAGEDAAIRTGLKWAMPLQEGEDYNDLHQRAGLLHVVEQIRGLVT
jgi:putative DNA primase/helicase